MAKKELDPCELVYNFAFKSESGTKYIDLAQCASYVNRRLYRQGKDYYVSRVSAVMGGGGAISLSTLPDSWVLANSFKKSYAIWRDMQKNVLKDNPSVEGKWADFKCFFDAAHYNGGYTSAGPTLNILPNAAAGTEVLPGEWYMSTFVHPQHDVDPATGLELAADEFKIHVLGDDVTTGVPTSPFESVAMIKGYQDTRARVQVAPDVPAAMSDSWMTSITDMGGQDPELAEVIEAENDAPPYNLTLYPGGDGNWNEGVTQSMLLSTASLPVDKDLGFKVPMGLIKVTWNVGSYIGAALKIHLVPGKYKGLHCTEVGQ